MSQVAEQQTDQRAQDAQYYRRVLLDLIEMGNDLARLVYRQARAQAEAAQPAADSAANAVDIPNSVPFPAATLDLMTVFERISRSVRRTVALVDKLAKPPRTAARSSMRRDIRETMGCTVERDAPEGLDADLLHLLDDPNLDVTSLSDEALAKLMAYFGRGRGIAELEGANPPQHRAAGDGAGIAARAAMPAPPEAPAASGAHNVAAMRPGDQTADPDKSTDPPNAHLA